MQVQIHNNTIEKFQIESDSIIGKATYSLDEILSMLKNYREVPFDIKYNIAYHAVKDDDVEVRTNAKKLYILINENERVKNEKVIESERVKNEKVIENYNNIKVFQIIGLIVCIVLVVTICIIMIHSIIKFMR